MPYATGAHWTGSGQACAWPSGTRARGFGRNQAALAAPSRGMRPGRRRKPSRHPGATTSPPSAQAPNRPPPAAPNLRHEASTPINRTQGLTIVREPVFPFRRPPLLRRARARRGVTIPAPHCQIQPPHALPRCSVVLRSSKPDAQNHQSPLAGIDRALPPPLAADEPLPDRPDLDS